MVVGEAFFDRVGVLFLVGDTNFLGVGALMIIGRAFFRGGWRYCFWSVVFAFWG